MENEKPPGRPRGYVDISGTTDDIKVSTETADERAARLRTEEKDANHARWRTTCALVGATFGLIGLAVVCVYFLLTGKGGPEAQKWAISYLAAMGTGLLSYVAGKKSNGK